MEVLKEVQEYNGTSWSEGTDMLILCNHTIEGSAGKAFAMV